MKVLIRLKNIVITIKALINILKIIFLTNKSKGEQKTLTKKRYFL